MASPTDPDLEQRMAKLIREVGADSPPTEGPRRPLGRFPRLSGSAGVGMALALLIGLQLGGLPWKFRRELWQAQGLVVGALVGFAIGRLSSGHSSRRDD